MPDKIDNKAFAEMQYATADKTAVDLLGDKPRVTKKDVHNMLMGAGFTPGLGNIADAADAVLYAIEGEFGSAALSSAAMIPFLGQFVSAKRAAKIVNKIPKRGYYSDKTYSKDRIFKVLEIKGKEVGHIGGKRTNRGISIDNIHVDEPYRRFGFGTDLYKSLQGETSGFVYSRGWQQNPNTAKKVWDSLVKRDLAEIVGEHMEPVYYLKKEGINLREFLKKVRK